MAAKKKHDFRITWSTDRSSFTSDIERFTARITYMETEPKYEGDTPGLRNPLAWDSYELAHLANLCIKAQRNIGPDRDHDWYGFALEYREVFSAGLAELEMMTKGLRSIRRKLDKLDEQFGRPQDLVTFCARVAVAIGCTDRSPFGQWCDEITFDGTHYKWTDADGLRYALDKITDKV